MKIFSKINESGENQIELFKKNPASVKNEINPDARQEIQAIYGSNKKLIIEQIGKCYSSG